MTEVTHGVGGCGDNIFLKINFILSVYLTGAV